MSQNHVEFIGKAHENFSGNVQNSLVTQKNERRNGCCGVIPETKHFLMYAPFSRCGVRTLAHSSSLTSVSLEPRPPCLGVPLILSASDVCDFSFSGAARIQIDFAVRAGHH